MKLICLVAASENRVIGLDNQMPWHLPDDFKFFKKTTIGFPIIMGKNTWISIGSKALPKRLNIIISSSLQIEADENIKVFKTVAESLAFLNENMPELEKAFIIGGGQIFNATMDIVDEILLTRVHCKLEKGTVFFPAFSEKDWKQVSAVFHDKDEKHQYSFTFEHWIRSN
ncbi:MAG TPA: dihydrofolate reductase [Edaphocola sp.]|nr:dihydrofolate reductase [Edaphocola sp.]